MKIRWFIPGLRPAGREISGTCFQPPDLSGAIALAVISVVPILLQAVFGIDIIFGGTGLIIVVGVVLETLKQIESHMLMRSYQGFMK